MTLFLHFFTRAQFLAMISNVMIFYVTVFHAKWIIDGGQYLMFHLTLSLKFANGIWFLTVIPFYYHNLYLEIVEIKFNKSKTHTTYDLF